MDSEAQASAPTRAGASVHPDASRALGFWAVIASLIISITGWGWAWVGIRAVVHEFPPGPLALGRYLVASAVLLPFWWMRGGGWPDRRDWLRVVAMGLLGFTFYNLAINAGEKTVTAGAGSLIAASIPVMLTLGARLFFGERLLPAGWVGTAVAFAGVAIITLREEGGLRLSTGALLVLAGSVCAAGFGLLSKDLLRRHHPLNVTTWAVWAGTLSLVPTGLDLGSVVRTSSTEALWTVVLLGAVPGALCYTLWSYVLAHWSLSRASSWQFLIPLASILLGWIFLGELPAPSALVGGAVTLSGVYLVNRRGRVPQPAAA